MIRIANLISRLILILFLLSSFHNLLNESKDTFDSYDFNGTLQHYFKQFNHNQLNYSKDKLSTLIQKSNSKRLIDQKQNERNQLCSFYQHTKCNQLLPECLNCNYNLTCVYGTRLDTICRAPKNYSCEVM